VGYGTLVAVVLERCGIFGRVMPASKKGWSFRKGRSLWSWASRAVCSGLGVDVFAATSDARLNEVQTKDLQGFSTTHSDEHASRKVVAQEDITVRTHSLFSRKRPYEFLEVALVNSVWDRQRIGPPVNLMFRFSWIAAGKRWFVKNMVLMMI